MCDLGMVFHSVIVYVDACMCTLFSGGRRKKETRGRERKEKSGGEKKVG